jgi:hypothetical protein
VLEPNWNSILLHYRAFNRLFHNPLAASLESFLLFLYLQSPSKSTLPSFLVLFLIHIGLHRLMLLGNKCLYVLVSLTTAYRNKKQRFASQTLCFLLEFTLLLPLFLLALLYSTLLNTATVPFLGFAYFLPGYPKPQRAWSALAPVAANGNDQRSDGHLYQAMMPQLERELARLFHGDPFLFRAGSFYLLKNEKMVALLQIVERGNNFLAYQLKGTELQETTVCHAEENEAINQASEAVFKRGQYDCNLSFSLAPVKQVAFGIYEDQKSSMAAIIDNPDFGKLFKRAFVRTLALKLNHLVREPGLKLYRVLKSDPSQKEMDLVAKLSDEAWLKAIGLDKAAFRFVSEPIPKVIVQTV